MRLRALLLSLCALLMPAAASADRHAIQAESQLIEAGQNITLELIVYRPPGTGPFPLVVFNHGSTGSGDRPELFRLSFEHQAAAEYFNRQGYIVVFPQRRGRGRSGGVYDEGFTPDRARYSCDPASARSAIDRAVEDIRAAIGILRTWPDVAPGPILLAGHSRGGLLSLLVAAAEPESVSGVINFSGGWMGLACPGYREVNQQLFARAGAWAGPSLFLYSDNDPFYPIKASRKNHAAFKRAGGKAQFVGPPLPARTNGHRLIDFPSAWSGPVGAFLRGGSD